jgi:hypothetical protein
MAKRVFDACGTRGKLLVMRGFTHDSPIYVPTEEYWEPIAEWVKQRSADVVAVRSLIAESSSGGNQAV